MAQNQAKQLAKIAMSNIREDDYVHRGFLKPIEIALKTYKTQILEEDNDEKLKRRSLPAGLKIAVSTSLNGDSRKLKDIEPIQDDQDYQTLKINSKDNILTLMKKKKHPKRQKAQQSLDEQHAPNEPKQLQGIKLAICVCMYSQTKPMLKRTLAGVAQNIANIVAYEGVDPDDIGVFVMMDGIEKVDDSIIGYFQQLERSSNINLGDNIVPSLTMSELAHRQQTMSVERINEEEMKNVNNYLFDPVELEERNSLRFQAVRSVYFEKKELLDYANKLKKGNKKLTYDDLNRPLQGFFLEQAKKMRKKDYNMTDQEVNELKSEVIIEEYISDIRRARPMIANAIQKAVEHCKAYLNGKEDLAYLSCFRRKIKFSSDMLDNYYEELERTMYQNSGQGLARSAQQLRETHEEQDSGPSTIMNLFLCVKYKNAGKLSSHNWFFNGFCKELKPQFAILLDVGLQPEGTALLKMYKYMEEHRSVGGVCGYMSLKMEKIEESEQLHDQDIDFLTSIASKFVDIQRTQQVEYHFAHLIDKPFEASFGFIHVLPGAFSAYNMEAILQYDKNEDDELLVNYFKSIDQKLAAQKIVQNDLGLANAVLRTALPDVFNRYCISIDPESDEAMLYNENVYLAEDRILCMGIHKKGFDMAFLPDAYAEVDPMKTVHGLLGQRKRWINGSYFAFEKVKKQLSEFESEHAVSCALNLQIFYLTFMNSMSYFSPALFMFTVHIAIEAFRHDVLSRWLASAVTADVLDFFVYTIDFIYVMMISSIVFYSLHFKNNVKQFKAKIYLVSTVFGLFMFIIMGVLLVDIVRGLIDNTSYLQTNLAPGQSANVVPQSLINLLRYLLVASMVLYFVPLIVYWFLFCHIQPLCQVILGYLSFLFYSPTYLNILNIYSLCRIDDISWGTKGLDSAGSGKNSALKGGWKLLKFIHVFKYVFWNIVVAAVLLTLGGNYQTRFWVTFGMVIMIGGSVGLKVVVAIIYMIIYKTRSPKVDGTPPNLHHRSRIGQKMKLYQPAIRKQIEEHIEDVKKQYVTTDFLGSFIQASRNKQVVSKAVKKRTTEKEAIVSSIFEMINRKSKMKLHEIKQEDDEFGHTQSVLVKEKKPNNIGGGFLQLFSPNRIESNAQIQIQKPGLLEPISIGSQGLLAEEDESKFEVKKPTSNKDKFRKGNQ